MSHELDINAGVASFVAAHEDGWHVLGTTLPRDLTAEDVLVHGRLGGWNVRKNPMTTTLPSGLVLPVPNRAAVLRDNPVIPGQVDVLGDVGSNYQIIQNEEYTQILQALVDDAGATFETAGALYGGRVVFVSMKVPSHIVIGGVDKVDFYIAAVSSHDGSMSFVLLTTPVRIVCANTLNSAFQNKSNIFRVQHRSGASKIIHAEARKALDVSFDYMEAFQAEAEMMIQTTMTQMEFEAIIEKEFGAPDDAAKATITRSERKIAEMTELFADAATQDGIRNTVWAGYNALTEWADHHAPVRGEDEVTGRAIKSVFSTTFKDKARSLMLAQC